MDLDDLFGPTPTVVDLQAKSRWEAIDELINEEPSWAGSLSLGCRPPHTP